MFTSKLPPKAVLSDEVGQALGTLKTEPMSQTDTLNYAASKAVTPSTHPPTQFGLRRL